MIQLSCTQACPFTVRRLCCILTAYSPGVCVLRWGLETHAVNQHYVHHWHWERVLHVYMARSATKNVAALEWFSTNLQGNGLTKTHTCRRTITTQNICLETGTAVSQSTREQVLVTLIPRMQHAPPRGRLNLSLAPGASVRLPSSLRPSHASYSKWYCPHTWWSITEMCVAGQICVSSLLKPQGSCWRCL